VTSEEQNLETAMMQLIRQQMGGAIRAAIAALGMAPSFEPFMAALAANESSGNASQQRREPRELMQFARVLMDEITEYQGIGSGLLMKAITQALLPSAIVRTLMNYCTSYGPTQIMGWHALKDGYSLSELVTLESHFRRCAGYVRSFQKEFNLAPPAADADAEKFFRCWNGGHPTAQTADPEYVAKGLRRMALYQQLAKLAA
jgi:hypothetical protein